MRFRVGARGTHKNIDVRSMCVAKTKVNQYFQTHNENGERRTNAGETDEERTYYKSVSKLMSTDGR